MAVEVDTQVLKTLHRILKQRTDLNDRKSRGPRKIKIAENATRELNEALEEVQEQKKRTRMLADQKQLQLQEREAKIEDLKGKRNACSSNREFQLLNDTIAAGEQAADEDARQTSPGDGQSWAVSRARTATAETMPRGSASPRTTSSPVPTQNAASATIGAAISRGVPGTRLRALMI